MLRVMGCQVNGQMDEQTGRQAGTCAVDGKGVQAAGQDRSQCNSGHPQDPTLIYSFSSVHGFLNLNCI